MRILQVTHRYPPQTGGVETHVQEISERLSRRGHDVTVFTADAGMKGDPRERRNGVDIRRFRSFAPGGAIYVAPGIVGAVRKHDADLVHAHNYHAVPALFAAIGVRDERFILTTHYHGQSPSSLRDRLLSLYEPAGRWAARSADQVIAVSEWERERLRADFGVAATVIPNGLDVDRFADAKPEERDRRYLLCVGRLVEYKGVQHAIRVLPELPEYDLVVVGSGPYREDLAQIAENIGVSERVDFRGFVPDDRLPAIYSGATVFLNLSRFEAYGITVAEALSSGTPCVILNTGGLQHWASESGVIGLHSPSSKCIVAAVREAAEQLVSGTVPQWSDVTDEVLSVYRR